MRSRFDTIEERIHMFPEGCRGAVGPLSGEFGSSLCVAGNAHAWQEPVGSAQ